MKSRILTLNLFQQDKMKTIIKKKKIKGRYVIDIAVFSSMIVLGFHISIVIQLQGIDKKISNQTLNIQIYEY